VEKSYPKSRRMKKTVIAEDEQRRMFAALLWRAFPEARSEADLAALVAGQLTTEDRPVHPKTVRNWLSTDNAPSFRYYLPVLMMAGGEAVLDLIYGGAP